MENWSWQRHGSAGDGPADPEPPEPADTDPAGEDETTARDVRVAGSSRSSTTRPDPPVAEGEVATEFPPVAESAAATGFPPATESAAATGFPPAGAHAGPDRRRSGDRLVDPAAAKRVQGRWRDVQAGFVDDPREATRQADALAGEAIEALIEALGTRRRSLAPDVGEPPDTELLRLALLAYRDLVDRILRT